MVNSLIRDICLALSVGLISGVLSILVYDHLISPTISPKPFVYIMHKEWITTPYNANIEANGNLTKFEQLVGTRLVEIDFENTGKANCENLNFSIQTANGTNLYWWTNISPNVTTSPPPPLVRVTNSYGGPFFAAGETKVNVFVQSLEPYEFGYVDLKVTNATFGNGAFLTPNQTYVNVTNLSLCYNADYSIINRTFT